VVEFGQHVEESGGVGSEGGAALFVATILAVIVVVASEGTCDAAVVGAHELVGVARGSFVAHIATVVVSVVDESLRDAFSVAAGELGGAAASGTCEGKDG